MKSTRISSFLRSDNAQILPIMALMVASFFATAALSVDLGRCYIGYRELQASTDASALAGANALPNSNAVSQATSYSSLSGDNNALNNIPNVTFVSGYPKVECLTTLSNEGMSCVAPGNGNAVQVKQQMTVNLFFAPIFGKKTLTLTATSTAGMRGATSGPYNVAIVLDTTQSMNDTDSDSQCNTSRLACSLSGIQVLLQDMSPCLWTEATCGTVTSGMVSNSVDRVSLFAFPNVTIGTVGDDYDCSSSVPTNASYTFPTKGASSYAPTGNSTPTYQIIPYSSDYRASDSSSTLSSTSNIVKAVGGKSGCASMSAPGGEGTYYAGVIYAAQASLVAEQAAYSGSSNMLIIISDGDASATSAHMTGASTTSGVYPSTVDQCAQAVTAAKAAATAGTTVISVAYGATSSGCSTDNPSITPCATMQNMASSTDNFYSDYTSSGGSSSCTSAAQPTTNLNQIFQDIAGNITKSRLIPNGTT